MFHENPLLRGMSPRRHKSVNLPGIVIDVVEASFEGEESSELVLDKTLLLLCLRGGARDGTRQAGDQSMVGSTPPGRLMILPPGIPLSGWLAGSAAGTSFIAVQFDTTFLCDLNLGKEPGELRPRLAAEDIEIVSQLHLLRREVEEPGLSSSLLISACTTILAVLLLRNHTACSERNHSVVGGLSISRLRVVQDFMEQHLAQDVPLATLASLADLSPFHFCRAFKKATGRSPHRYRIERRVERAKQLLTDPGFPVASIATACGFASSSHFATTFAKITGRSPSQYRREM